MQISSQTLVTVTLTEQEVVQILAERTAISGWRIEVWDVDAPDAVGGSDMEWEARITLHHEYPDPDAVPDDLVAQLLATEVYEEDGTVTAVVNGDTLEELIAEQALPVIGLTPGEVDEGALRDVWVRATDAEPRILTFTWIKSNNPDGSLRMSPTRATGVDQTEGGALKVTDPIAYGTFTAPELATVLAGLRLLQETIARDGAHLASVSDILGDASPPLSAAAMDALCERLNTGADEVVVVVITHRHGTDVWAAGSQGRADEIVFRYVADWWSQEIHNERMPTDRAEAARRYFEVVEHECCYIARVPVLTDPPRRREEASDG